MKGLVISCLIFTLFHPISSGAIATASMRWPLVNPVANNIRAWCADTPNPRACFASIETSPRNDLKTTPEGAALILIDSAKANIRSTTAFITDNMASVSDNDVAERLDNCLKAFDAIGSALDFDSSSLDSPDGRASATTALNRTDDEVSYDCGWQTLHHNTPVAQQLTDRVQRFAECVEAAGIILSAIDS